MRSSAGGCLAIALLACACGGSSADGSSDGGEVASGGARASDVANSTTCAPDDTRLLLRGAFEVVSEDAEAGADPEGRGIIAITGADTQGNEVYWRRAGDIG